MKHISYFLFQVFCVDKELKEYYQPLSVKFGADQSTTSTGSRDKQHKQVTTALFEYLIFYFSVSCSVKHDKHSYFPSKVAISFYSADGKCAALL